MGFELWQASVVYKSDAPTTAPRRHWLIGKIDTLSLCDMSRFDVD